MVNFSAAEALLTRIKAADEALDVDAFVVLISEDVAFRLGSRLPLLVRANFGPLLISTES